MKKILRTLGVLAVMMTCAHSAVAYTPVTPISGGGTAGTTSAAAISNLGFKYLDLSNAGLPTGGDDTAAINVVTAAAKAAGAAVYAPCGTYKHAGVITVDTIRLFGDGPCTVFQSTDATTPNPNLAINLKGTAPKLDHVKITTTWAGARQANLQADAVWVGTLLSSLVTNFEVSDITIDGTGAAGIGPSYAEGGIITRNFISNTLADSITLQNAYGHTSHVTVSNNNIKNSGDACVSVNSYQSGHNNGEATPASDIAITGNICNTPVAVGINVCGGNDVTLVGNTIQSSGAEGFYSISGSSFFCQAVNNVTFADNIITSPNTGGSAIGSIRVEGASGFLNTNTKIHHNTITNAKTSGIRVGAGTAVYVYNTEVTNNVINGAGESGASHQGLAINGANNTFIAGNTISNWDDEGVWTPSSSLNTGYLKLMNNHVDQVNLGAGSVYAYLLDNTGLSELDFIGNTQTNGSSTVTGCWYMTSSTPNINAFANDCENTTVSGGGLRYRTATQDSATMFFDPTNDSGAHNSVGVGLNALLGQTGSSAAYQNTAVGQGVMASGTLTTAALRNTAMGRAALANLTSGADNTAVGVSAASANTSGGNNVAMGRLAAQQNQSGSSNTVIGTFAGQGVSSNSYSFDTFIGSTAADTVTTGGNNTAVGYSALGGLTTGTTNSTLGVSSCNLVTTGAGNSCLGYNVGNSSGPTTQSNVMLWGVDSTTNSATSNTAIIKGTGTAILSCTGTDSATIGPACTLGGQTTAPAFTSGGTKFTTSGGGCTVASTVGGATAGQFAANTTGTCTTTITMNGATGMTAPNGWTCWASDITTGIAGAQTASSTTTATIAIATTSGNTVSFGCVGY